MGMLQWGRAWEPGGARQLDLAGDVHHRASMGPGLGARRGPRFRLQLPQCSAASMGPGLGARRGRRSTPRASS